MSNDLAKFGIGLEFKKALAGVKKLKAEVRSLNNMQTKMNKIRRAGKSVTKNKPSSEKKSNMKHEEAVAKAINAERLKTVSAEKSLLKERVAKEKMIDNARVKQAAGKITQGSGSEGVKSFYEQQQREANDLLKKGNTERKKAQRLQEQLGAAMAKDTNKVLSAERARVKALERAKEAIENSAFMMKKGANAAERQAQANIRSSIASAKTTSSLRRAVAMEKASLRNAQKKTFLLQRMEASSKGIAGNMVSAFAIAAGGAFVTKTGQDFEAVANTMLAVSKDSKQAGENLKFAKEEAYRLGLGLKESSKGFAKLLAARGDMSLGDTKNLFSGISEMGSVLGLTAEEGGRALTAVQQMASKGVISAEELKLQLGEVMPNALQIMAQSAKDAGLAVDGTVKSMLALQQKGGLISSKVLPKFAENLRAAARNNGGLDKALLSNRISMNQMITSVQMAADTVFNSGWSEGLTDLFKSIGELFKENETFFKSFGKIAGAVFKVLAFVVRNVLNPVLSAFGSILNLITTAMSKFGDWVGIVLVYFARFTPLVGSAIKMMGGFKGVFKMLGSLAKRILLPFTLILGVLEEIAEFFAPTGKKTALGFNVDDMKMPDWMKGGGAITDVNSRRDRRMNQSMPQSKETPIIVQTEFFVGQEQFGRAAARSNAVKSEIASQIAENNSSNY